jgi:hypothetical protein
MQYEIIITSSVEADSPEEAELKYRDTLGDIDQHQIYWYDEEGNRHEIPEEAYNVED